MADEEEIAEEPKKTKKKKVVIRRRKTKEKENPLISAIRLAVESGKTDFGARTGIMASLLGKAKIFIVASNTPAGIKDKVTEYSKKAGIPVIEFPGNTIELGSVCGKPFSVSVLSVYDEGNSNLLELAK